MASKPRKLKCKAKAKRTGQQCGRWALEGYEVCMVHGAGTKKRVKDGDKQPPGAPIKTGRYADTVRHPTISALIEEFMADQDPMNLLPELATCRALLTDFINRHARFTDALFAWHNSWGDGSAMEDRDWAVLESIAERAEQGDTLNKGLAKELNRIIEKNGAIAKDKKPIQLLDIGDAYKILGEVTKIGERIRKMELMESLSKTQVDRLMTQMGAAAAEVLEAELGPQEAERMGDAIALKWGEIRL